MDEYTQTDSLDSGGADTWNGALSRAANTLFAFISNWNFLSLHFSLKNRFMRTDGMSNGCRNRQRRRIIQTQNPMHVRSTRVFNLKNEVEVPCRSCTLTFSREISREILSSKQATPMRGCVDASPTA